MYIDQTYRTLSFENITIEGSSRAAVQTFWRIPEYKLGFDIGAQPWSFMGTPNWFISHTHMDHLLALPAYIARRRMMKMEPPTVYLPEEGVDSVRQLLGAFSRLDRGRLPCNLVGLKPGQEVELSRELIVQAVKTFHTLPSLGYIVWERRKKLKPEYLELSGEQIRDLNKSGVEISYEIRIPRVAYLGDSTAKAFGVTPELLKADVLILELTFVAPEHKKEAIQKFGHIHLDDIVERRDDFANKLVIASHFSSRYNDNEIVQTITKRIPDMFGGRLVLWI
ncbi:MAG: MBL fold metallo-hydrolase [Thermoguttaceae bacterium]